MKLNPFLLIHARLVFGLLFGLALGPSSAYGDLSSARTQLNDAYAKFFNALKSAPDLSPTTVDALSSTHIAPVQKAYDDSLQDELKARSPLPPRHAYKPADPDPVKRDQKRRKREGDKGPKEKDSKTKTAGSSDTPLSNSTNSSAISQPTYESEPEVVIDGTGIPKEIEFSGKKSPLPSEQAKPKGPAFSR